MLSEQWRLSSSSLCVRLSIHFIIISYQKKKKNWWTNGRKRCTNSGHCQTCKTYRTFNIKMRTWKERPSLFLLKFNPFFIFLWITFHWFTDCQFDSLLLKKSAKRFVILWKYPNPYFPNFRYLLQGVARKTYRTGAVKPTASSAECY